MEVVDGRFHLLVRDADAPGTRRMVYLMPLRTADGQNFFFEGFKLIHDDAGPDMWSDTTTLYVTIRENDEAGDVAAKGIIKIHVNDFRKQLATMKVTGTRNPLEQVKTMAKFGRFFMGALNEVYGGVFAKPSAFVPDAPPRVRRPLRCGVPEIHEFTTEDNVQLRLTRFKGGTKGPVILSPGFGTSSFAYTIDTTDTNYPEYLYENDYDVWVLDYRASPDLPSSSTQFTLDDVARYDYPAAVETVRRVTGAESVQIMAHCVGGLTLMMSLATGLKHVRSAVVSQLTLHPRVTPLNKVRSETHMGSLLAGMGVDTLTTDFDDSPGWAERLYDKALRVYPAGKERCANPFCRRVLFMYGEVYDHDQLNDATHEALHEAFGVANLSTLKQISAAIRNGHAVTAQGEDVYLNADGLKLPIAFIHGEYNRLFLPEGSQKTYEYLCQQNGTELYSRHVIRNYAHMDCFVGKDAARDVYPIVTAELDRYNQEVA
jgi:choline dehydrogenase-like flavoprotein